MHRKWVNRSSWRGGGAGCFRRSPFDPPIVPMVLLVNCQPIADVADLLRHPGLQAATEAFLHRPTALPSTSSKIIYACQSEEATCAADEPALLCTSDATTCLAVAVVGGGRARMLHHDEATTKCPTALQQTVAGLGRQPVKLWLVGAYCDAGGTGAKVRWRATRLPPPLPSCIIVLHHQLGGAPLTALPFACPSGRQPAARVPAPQRSGPRGAAVLRRRRQHRPRWLPPLDRPHARPVHPGGLARCAAPRPARPAAARPHGAVGVWKRSLCWEQPAAQHLRRRRPPAGPDAAAGPAPRAHPVARRRAAAPARRPPAAAVVHQPRP